MIQIVSWDGRPVFPRVSHRTGAAAAATATRRLGADWRDRGYRIQDPDDPQAGLSSGPRRRTRGDLRVKWWIPPKKKRRPRKSYFSQWWGPAPA